MLSQDEQVALFVDAINKNALKMRREIEKETKKLYADEAQKLEEAAKKELEEKLSYAENEIFTELNRKAAADKSLYRHELYKRREELTNGVFLKAEKIISDFASGENYVSFLEKSINSIKSYIGESFTLFSRASDMKSVKEASEKAGVRAEIKEDNIIRLGGVKAQSEDGSKIIDDTLDERLSEQKDWFLSHTGSELNV